MGSAGHSVGLRAGRVAGRDRAGHLLQPDMGASSEEQRYDRFNGQQLHGGSRKRDLVEELATSHCGIRMLQIHMNDNGWILDRTSIFLLFIKVVIITTFYYNLPPVMSLPDG